MVLGLSIVYIKFIIKYVGLQLETPTGAGFSPKMSFYWDFNQWLCLLHQRNVFNATQNSGGHSLSTAFNKMIFSESLIFSCIFSQIWYLIKQLNYKHSL